MDRVEQLAEHVQLWHSNIVSDMRKITEAAKVDEIRLGEGDDPVVLAGDKAAGFRMGVMVALSMVEKLPFTVEKPTPEQRVTRLIAGHLGIDPEEVRPDSKIGDDLGADSLDMVEMTLDAEEAFDIELPDDVVEKIVTVQDAIDAVRSHMEPASAA